jgi:hypothetical protein
MVPVVFHTLGIASCLLALRFWYLLVLKANRRQSA